MASVYPMSAVIALARGHGIYLTDAEAEWILWNETPYPMIRMGHPHMRQLLRKKFAELEMDEEFRGVIGLARRLVTDLKHEADSHEEEDKEW